jgi:hypothetical protein
MKYFPSLCVDDFYSDPDRVRNFALSLPYYANPEGRWPGVRTNELESIDRVFYELFCKKLFSLFFDLEKVDIKYYVSTSFQMIDAYDKSYDSPKNKGWIHYDTGSVFAGVIYLNDNGNVNAGTSLYRLINPNNLELGEIKEDFYKSNIDKNYDDHIKKHNLAFEETVRYNNVYNRLICFDGEVAHGANHFISGQNPRLTQVFFVNEIEINSHPPVPRHKNFL